MTLNRHDVAIQKSDDSMIQVLGTRTSGDVDYRIGRDIHVTWKGGNCYFCHRCHSDLRWANETHQGCTHIQRIERYREEHA